MNAWRDDRTHIPNKARPAPSVSEQSNFTGWWASLCSLITTLHKTHKAKATWQHDSSTIALHHHTHTVHTALPLKTWQAWQQRTVLRGPQQTLGLETKMCDIKE